MQVICILIKADQIMISKVSYREYEVACFQEKVVYPNSVNTPWWTIPEFSNKPSFGNKNSRPFHMDNGYHKPRI
jgi:hypothetical protein